VSFAITLGSRRGDDAACAALRGSFSLRAGLQIDSALGERAYALLGLVAATQVDSGKTTARR